MDVLRRWRLKPINPSDPCWKHREARSEIVVSAENENNARIVALIETEGYRHIVPRMQPNSYSPWNAASVTTCEEISTKQFTQ